METDGSCAEPAIFHTGFYFFYVAMSSSPEKMFRNYMFYMRWQIQSAFHEKSTLALELARNGA